MTEVKVGPRARRIVAAATAAFGPRWQSPLSRSAGVSQALLTKIAKGQRGVTDEVEDLLVKAFWKEVARLDGSALRVSSLIGQIESARDK